MHSGMAIWLALLQLALKEPSQLADESFGICSSGRITFGDDSLWI